MYETEKRESRYRLSERLQVGDSGLDKSTKDFVGRVMNGVIEEGNLVGVLAFLEEEISLSSPRDFYLGYLVGALMGIGADFASSGWANDLNYEDKAEIREMIAERLPRIRERVERELGK